MNFAGRMNSFIFKGKDVFDAIESYKKMDGITHLEFNYPEHLAGYDLTKIKEAMGPLKVNGVALRFRDQFKNGEFTNPDPSIRQKAIQLCKDAADVCAEIGGQMVTIWLAFDGFDYPFQMDYEEEWEKIITAIREVADYAPHMKFSIEYKPFEPRNFSMIDSFGTTMLAIEEINRPNVGGTLDFCHMLMKHDGPAYGLSVLARRHKLFGLHMNDGYSQMDSGMIFGSINLAHSLEFIYYLKKYHYEGVVFFDTFPVREEAGAETQANIRAFQTLSDIIDQYGMDRIEKVIKERDGIKSQSLILDMLK